MTFDLETITVSKERYRRKLAALPFAEKLRILDRMRERDTALRSARLKLPRPAARKSPEGTVDEPLRLDV